MPPNISAKKTANVPALKAGSLNRQCNIEIPYPPCPTDNRPASLCPHKKSAFLRCRVYFAHFMAPIQNAGRVPNTCRHKLSILRALTGSSAKTQYKCTAYNRPEPKCINTSLKITRILCYLLGNLTGYCKILQCVIK